MRYLLTAVALLELPLDSMDLVCIQRRAGLILHNYTRALNELTDPDVHCVDSAMAPILAWLLETFAYNENRAGMHCNGAKTAFDLYAPLCKRLSRKTDEYIMDDNLRLFLNEIRRFSCTRCKSSGPEDDQILLAVAVRNLVVTPQTTQHIRRVLREYVDGYNPAKMTPNDIEAAAHFQNKWLIAVTQSRYRSSEPNVIWTGLNLLVNTIGLLLPLPVVNPVAGDETEAIGVEYMLDQCYWIIHPAEKGKAVTEAIKDIVIMMLQLISRGASDPGLRTRAKRLWSEVVSTGTIADQPPDRWLEDISLCPLRLDAEVDT